MKRKIGWLVLVLVFAVSGCSNRQDNTTIQEVKKTQQTDETGQKSTENDNREAASSDKILIAYFTLADNYEKPSDMDATSQASINLENKELIGNTEYFANAIHAWILGFT